jgi:hypothetical protein
MAHFAELDDNNVVIRVITFLNKEVNENGGDLSTQAENFVAARHGGRWKQTSYNGNFRKQYTGIGDTYDPVKDIFIKEQPFPSWTLDVNSDWNHQFLILQLLIMIIMGNLINIFQIGMKQHIKHG